MNRTYHEESSKQNIANKQAIIGIQSQQKQNILRRTDIRRINIHWRNDMR